MSFCSETQDDMTKNEDKRPECQNQGFKAAFNRRVDDVTVVTFSNYIKSMCLLQRAVCFMREMYFFFGQMGHSSDQSNFSHLRPSGK